MIYITKDLLQVHLNLSEGSTRQKKSKKSAAVVPLLLYQDKSKHHTVKMLFWLLGWKTYLRTMQYPNLTLKNLCIISKIFAIPVIPLSVLSFLLSWNVFCAPESRFSIIKHILVIHGYSLKEDTIEALRVAKDHHPSWCPWI